VSSIVALPWMCGSAHGSVMPMTDAEYQRIVRELQRTRDHDAVTDAGRPLISLLDYGFRSP
jgi:hypothetical protein